MLRSVDRGAWAALSQVPGGSWSWPRAIVTVVGAMICAIDHLLHDLSRAGLHDRSRGRLRFLSSARAMPRPATLGRGTALVKVLVAGASGVIGRPVVRRLAAAGHDVSGTTPLAGPREGRGGRRRDARRLRRPRCRGAYAPHRGGRARGRRPRADRASEGARPAQEGHLRGDKPPAPRGNGEPGRGRAGRGRAPDRRPEHRLPLRADGRLGEGRGRSADAGRPRRFGDALDAALDLERQVLGAEGLEGLVLRYGFFYGPGSSYASDGYQAGEVRRRRFPIVGRGTAPSPSSMSTTPRRPR